ncbi:50S ribosomal protein L11 methyltransferase [Niabella drilacis]|uniref:Ribosomal protein L11 methyltransferase n=1 Tax=Niabella drilacis (strain DSM 25811 / CCM 8410 / CCUG 62505 / LMG 26954 / E90) TaxID=1285928 RepID=A0A1G6KMW7_NIADE|nr:50S ribosomal protein L11 methyltransferase [Niabella drilacis]SDC32168.1 ribosomal protein L11 methyltransferase [Niabella drilacis]
MSAGTTYTEVVFLNTTTDLSALLIAALADKADGFEEADTQLKAFFSQGQITTAELDAVSGPLHIHYEVSELESQNWNALWESNFDPVVVDGFVAVRASFHPSFENVEQEIVINPKMSFGTGHHATTWMMMQQMREVAFSDKQVFDFGTGTGILSILAEKLGARQVLATDIDEWSILNTIENIGVNHCSRITVQQSDSAVQGGVYDVILANINKNVLMETIPSLKEQLAPGGVLLLSGLLAADEPEIVSRAVDSGLRLDNKVFRNNWLCMKLVL